MKCTARLATFFTCYPEPLGLPDAGSHMYFIEQPMSGFEDAWAIGLHYDNDEPAVILDPSSAVKLFVSLRFHAANRSVSLIQRQMDDLRQVLGQSAPQLLDEDGGDESMDDDAVSRAFTVVEMVTPVVRPADGGWIATDPDDDVMPAALTRCIDTLVEVVTAYRLTEGLLLPPPARERLGPLIQWGTRPADLELGGWDENPGGGHTIINVFALPSQVPKPPAASETSEDRIAGFLSQRAIKYPATAVMELQADADVALEMRGDFRAAVVLLHTASEVLLDTALMLICWEEGLTPEEAAVEFTSPLVGRIRTKYHDRIGGAWDTKSGVVRRWHRDLVLVRHRVTHAGEVLDRESAELARTAYRDMRAHLLNRLLAKMGRYPKTAAMMLTESGLRRRNQWTRRARAAVASVNMDTFQEFSDWREQLLVLRSRVGPST